MKNKILALSLTLLFSSALALSSVAETMTRQNNLVILVKDGKDKTKKSCKTKSCEDKKKSCNNKNNTNMESKSTCCCGGHKAKSEQCNHDHSKMKENDAKSSNKEEKK